MYLPPKGIFIARLDNTAVSAARTLVQINVASTVIAVPIEFLLSFSSITSTSIRTRISKRTTAGTGSSFTPVRLSGAASAASGATNNHTAEGTVGDVLFDEFVNYLIGQPFKLPVPEGRIVLAPSERLALDFPSAPGASITLSASISFAEFG